MKAEPQDHRVVDEVGYLFKPPDYNYDIEDYFREFSHKSAKRLKREVAAFDVSGVSYRCDDISDFEHLVRLNVGSFGAHSYFHDHRFLESFRSLLHYLNDNGWLRMTTVLIGGEVAAVDMGCVYRGAYTLLGGGTNGQYPGVAKLINLYHMRRGCQERLSLVDFLCGDFSWKKLFHLAPRPLYLLSNCTAEAHCPESLALRGAGHVE
ncbi:MAG: GNAT family N-acetyltransferase [Planctomycetes bacterium]|nr:GNAT family N-acetyltransferase [Planctomycetota bacterium]